MGAAACSVPAKEARRAGFSDCLGSLILLEGCRTCSCRHLVYASSSSVYGANTKLPLSVGVGLT